jgi:phospholipase C
LNVKVVAVVLVLFGTIALIACGGAAGTSQVITHTPPSTPPPPPQPSTPALQHIIVVVMQNGSFDHYFGMFPGVDGIRAGVNGYSQTDAAGNTVTPSLLTNVTPPDLPHGRNAYLGPWDNGAMDKYAFYNGDMSMQYYDNTIPGVDKLWSWAQQYALGDEFFPSVMSSAPANQLYMIAAADNNYVYAIEPYYGPCNTTGVVANAPYTFTHVGDQLNAANITWAWYQDNYGQCSLGYISQQNPFQFFTDSHNAANVQDGSNLYKALPSGNIPAVSFLQPSPAHSTHPGSGSVTNGLTWLDSFIKSVQASPAWPDTAIVIIWDESGGWWDHVSPPQVDSQGYGARVPLLVISPKAKKNYVSHVQMDFVSILKFIQWNWNLQPLNDRNKLGTDLRDMFQF